MEKRQLESHHFYQFGCLVLIHKANFIKEGFAPKCDLGIFLGFDEDYVFGTAKVLSLHTGRIVHSRTLQFFNHILPYARTNRMYLEELRSLARTQSITPVWDAEELLTLETKFNTADVPDIHRGHQE